MRAAADVDLLADRTRMADRADLRRIAREGQPDRPVDDRAHLAGGAGDLTHVVGPGHPPGDEAADAERPELADGLVTAEVDEGCKRLVGERLRARRRTQLAGDVVRKPLALANRVLGRGRARGAVVAARVRDRG